MKTRPTSIAALLCGTLCTSLVLADPPAGREHVVDFRYSPPQWQCAICFPDDPQKTLVDKTGQLLYQYRGSGREFCTQIAVETAPGEAWQGQRLVSPRTPIVKTSLAAKGLRIVQEAFAVTGLTEARRESPSLLRRVDHGGAERNRARPKPGIDPTLKHRAVHDNGSIRYEVAGRSFRVALGLCEGYWALPGKRVEILRVEGAPPRTVDTAADIGKNKAAVFWFDATDTNGDGKIEIAVSPADGAADKKTILNGLWVFDGKATVTDAALLAGSPQARPLARLSLFGRAGPPRNDMILVHVTNTDDRPRTIRPRLIVDSTLGFRRMGQRVVIDGHETVTSSLRMIDVARLRRTRQAVALEPQTIAPGKSVRFFVLYSAGERIVVRPTSVEEALAARDRAAAYWRSAPLPWNRIQVPDAGVQALLDSSIRNIWQARESKNGHAVFQVGPTCYRGLWIVDGAFLLEAATMLGAGDQARDGVAAELAHQKPDGRIHVMDNYWKENGIVLWTCVRHARLTRDRAWLRSVWPKLQRIAAFLRTLRRRTLRTSSPLDDGLIPPGFPDGGLAGVRPEYSNVYWNLVGLRAFVEAARWLGNDAEAATWQKEYDDFLAAFRKAAARDTRTDGRGHRYLPILMGAQGAKELPQRGQWAFCHAVYPGGVFPRDDPLVAGHLAMLRATEREGMVYGTGWDSTGIWTYFASFYGHAWLWQGQGQKAARTLYAYANHAAPVLVWREEQSLRARPYHKVGDMPHNWASAEFIRLAVHLLELDRGRELHLLEGLPSAWTGPGMVTRLGGVATPFGPLTMALRISSDGKTANLRVAPLPDPACRQVVVHLHGWASKNADAVIRLDPRRPADRNIPLPAHAETTGR